MPALTCPFCAKTLTYPETVCGRDTVCPLCGSRFSVTAAGEPVQPKATKPAVVTRAAPAGPPIRVMCPTCTVQLSVPANHAGQRVRCTNCGQKLLVPMPPKPSKPVQLDKTILAPMADDLPAQLDAAIAAKSAVTASAAPPLPSQTPAQVPSSPFAALDTGSPTDKDPDRELVKVQSKREPVPHSGLGIASFLIAVLVGGLDVILILVIGIGLARASGRLQLGVQVASGGMAFMCLNVLSIPLCLVGAGLGLVALIAHQGRNHLFTWIGLLANVAVILTVMGLYILAAVLDAATTRGARVQDDGPALVALPVALNEAPKWDDELDRIDPGVIIFENSATLNRTDLILNGKPARVYRIRLIAGKRYRIDMRAEGAGFGNDPYLVLVDPNNREVARDDDGGGGFNARINYRARSGGDYTIQATCLGGVPPTGMPFRLTIRRL